MLTVFHGAVPYAQGCLGRADYAKALKARLSESVTEGTRLAKYVGQKDAAPDDVLQIDLSDPNQITERITTIKEQIQTDTWKLPEAPCSKATGKALQLEAKLTEQLRQNADMELTLLTGLASIHQEKHPQNSATQDLGEKSEEIESSLATTEKTREAIDQAKKSATTALETAESTEARKAARLLLELEDYRGTLANEAITWLSELKSIVQKYKLVSAEIDKVNQSLEKPLLLSDPELTRLYKEVTGRWRTLIDDAYLVYQMTWKSSSLSKPPRIPAEEILGKLPTKARQELEASYELAREEHRNVLSKRKQEITDHIEDFYSLLDRASQSRSDAMSQMSARDLPVSDHGRIYLDDLGRELVAIPFRFLGMGYRKYLHLKEDLGNGIWGIGNIMGNSLFALLILCIPFFARFLAGKLQILLDRQRSKLLRNYRRTDRRAVTLAIWIQRLTPYIPWVAYGIILRAVHNYIPGSAFEEIGILFVLFGYFIGYKIFRLLISDLYHAIRNLSSNGHPGTQNLVHETSRLIGYFFLFALILLALTEETVDQGLLYRGVTVILEGFGLVVCAYAAYRWRHMLAPAARTVFGAQTGETLAEWCEGRVAILAALPTLIMIVCKFALDASWKGIAKLEFTKRLLAKIYRKKIESLVGENNTATAYSLPDEYTDLFSSLASDNLDLVVAADEPALDRIAEEIKGWLSNDEDDQSVAIYGQRGIGKSVMLERIARRFPDLNILRLKVPPKTWQRESVGTFLSESLGVDKTDNVLKAVLEFNKIAEKNTLILVDDAHNLFLGKYGGFEGFRAYIEAVNLKTEKLFWCSVFNEYSWAYLKGVLGPSQYLRTEISLDQWSDEQIKQLILKRHHRSSFTLSYDQMILASRSQVERQEASLQAEEQFFRLLWEQAGGNPQTALYLWTNCLSLFGRSTLRVGLPERPTTDTLAGIEDTSWFVLASVVRHDNLTRKEAVSTTNLNWPQVAHALKRATENKLIERQGSRYRLHISHQYDVLKQLKMKNFVYGIR